YWTKRPGLWSHGDLAVKHEDGSWELRGRADDVLKISGRRVGPAEIEEAAIACGASASAAIGIPDARSGQAVLLLAVAPASREAADPGFAQLLRDGVAARLGAALRPKHVVPVEELPRTRNGKILRRLVRAIALGEKPGDMSSLENP